MTEETPDWKAIRGEFPALRNRVYLATASGGAVHPSVLEAARAAYEDSVNHAGLNWSEAMDAHERVRHAVALFIGAERASDVALLRASSFNMSLFALALARRFPERRHVVSLEDEFPSTVLPFEHQGFQVERVAPRGGAYSPDAILERLRPDTAAVAVSHVQFATGFRLDLESLARQLPEAPPYLAVNATQSIGALRWSLERTPVSFLVCSCYKWLLAGYGIALAYAPGSVWKTLDLPVCGWQSVEDPDDYVNVQGAPYQSPLRRTRSLECGVGPLEASSALEAALDLQRRLGPANTERRILDLSGTLTEALEREGFEVKSPTSRSERSGIVSVAVPPGTSETVCEFLSQRDVHVSARRGLLRAAIHFYNDEDDLERYLTALLEARSGGLIS